MRVWKPRVWIAVFSATAVAVLVFGAIGRPAPGELTAVHQAVADLTGWNSCAQCHGGWTSNMTESCLECHQLIGDQFEGAAGLHGSLGKSKGMQCALCHSEHHGAGFDIVNRQSYAMAGVRDPDEFDHGLVGFEMAGKHLTVDCSDCHPNARVDVRSEGEHRFLGLTQDCSNCHKDSHDGRMVLACAECHGQESFTELSAPGHANHLPLIGSHADAACRDCHLEDSVHSLDSLGRGQRPTSRKCAKCHESPHSPDFTANAAKLIGTEEDASCSGCHGEHLTFRDPRLMVSAAEHACSGFALDTPHDEAECADCHIADADSFAARYPGRGPDQCSQCHEDPHGGQFSEGAFAKQECTACHEREWFEPHAFTTEQHASTALPLTNSHLELDCHECHAAPAEGAPRVFRGTTPRCDGCHGDAHEGFFARVAKARPAAMHRAEAPEGDCDGCHLTTKFADVPPDGFEHERWTGLPITGAHSQTECESCHPRAAEPDSRGRTFGRVAEHFGAYTGCVTCHSDPHGGQFDAPGSPTQVGGRTGCARCHVDTSFRSFPNGFDHRLWTGFPLAGKHGEIGCSPCHPATQPSRGGDRVWAKALGRQCADCHTDPHGGQLAKRGRTDCQRCHQSVATFAEFVFDHDRQSRFKLGEAHASLDCSACHKLVVQDDREIVRYRPLGRNCVDCHGAHRDPLRRAPRKDPPSGRREGQK